MRIPRSLLLAFGLVLASCSGGTHASSVAGVLPTTPQAKLANTTFTVTIPAPAGVAAASSARRTPQYVPASTHSLAFTVLSSSTAGVTVPFTETANVSPGTAPCGSVSAGNYTCSITVGLPAGSDTILIAAYDAASGSGNRLSQKEVTETLTLGTTNALPAVTLDGIPGSITVAGLVGPTGTYPNFTVNGTSNATFTLGNLDTHGTAFGSQPNVPTITNAAVVGTGAAVSISGSTLTFTPPTTATSATVAVAADPAGARDVTTTLTNSPSASATSFTVNSLAGISAGEQLTLDYEAFNGTTPLQENVTVTSVVSGTNTVNIASGLTFAHGSGADVRHYSDNLVPAFASFTVSVAETVIAPVGFNMASGNSTALVFNTSLVQQTGSLSDMAEFDYARFDTADQLFIADQTAELVYRSTYTPGAGLGAITNLTGIPSQSGNFGFDVSSNGTVLVENSYGTDPQLDIFPSGSTSPTSPGFNSTLNNGTYNTVTAFLVPTAAILTDNSGAVFGYAYSVYDTTVNTKDRIVVTNGTPGSDQIITAGVASQNQADGNANGTMTWDQGRQSLIYGNSENGGTGFNVFEYPRNGTSGALLSTTPDLIVNTTVYPVSVAASLDGSYVAVATTDGQGGARVSIYHFTGASWSLSSGGGALAADDFINFTSVHFLPNGNLVVSDSQDGGGYAHLEEFTTAGVPGPTDTSVENLFGSGFTIEDVAVSY